MTIDLLHDGPSDARATIVLAHGAGAGMRHPFLQQAAVAFAAAGFHVVRFEFPYRAAGKGAPDPMPKLEATMAAVVAQVTPPFLLAGKSLGGRVATRVADRLAAAGVIVFGYPFHPPNKPAQLRTAHLADLATPTWIVQGERDPFGTPSEVATYQLSPRITIEWLPDGDHSLAPRKRSGHTPAGHFATALAAAIRFADRCFA